MRPDFHNGPDRRDQGRFVPREGRLYQNRIERRPDNLHSFHSSPPRRSRSPPPPPFHTGRSLPPQPHPAPRHVNPPLTLSGLPIHQVMPPLMHFKSFMLSQTENIPPEEFKGRYDDYCLKYVKDFSEAFFGVSKGEEWFQERYNPLKIKSNEEEVAQWAALESNAILSSLNSSPLQEFLDSMCLEPSFAEARSGESKIAGRHFEGHADRTIYVSGIHAACEKSLFKSAVEEVLTNSQNGCPAPIRTVVSQPVWTIPGPGSPSRFERNAWVVMPSVAAAEEALPRLRAMRVTVPGTMDAQSGERPILYQFEVQAGMHHSRNMFTSAQSSDLNRIGSDELSAIQLAELLDEEKGVPRGSRCSAILQLLSELSTSMRTALRKTDKLDVAIGYLRRVHFVSFYAGKKFIDEAHLLTMSPSCWFRGDATSSPLKDKISMDGTPGVAAEVSADSHAENVVTPEKEKADSSDGDSESGEDSDGERAERRSPREDQEVRKDSPGVEEKSSPSPRQGAAERFSAEFLSDRRILSLIADARARVRDKQSGRMSKNEEDAKIISEKHSKTLFDGVKTHCIPEKDDKFRCWFPYCAKLFKSMEFMVKHVCLKHEDFAKDAQLWDAEPFMKKRYDDEDVGVRPLPPVLVECIDGSTEIMSVVEIIEKAKPPVVSRGPPRFGMGGGSGGRRRYLHGGRGDFRGREGGFSHFSHNQSRGSVRGRDDRDSLLDTTAGSGTADQSGEALHSDNALLPPPKKLMSYMDVDAPKEVAPSIDYGMVILPPVKKRKLAKKETSS